MILFHRVCMTGGQLCFLADARPLLIFNVLFLLFVGMNFEEEDWQHNPPLSSNLEGTRMGSINP